ncbi:MAG: hypothetical protein JNK85_13280 [Verrucomicrobiales bacterium]|nr:hypothetical protein [Verrucomicrobiales bacterium]
MSHASDSVQRELHTLRLTLQITLVSLVILSGSIGVYLYRQVSLLKRQSEANQRSAQQMAHQFNSNFATQYYQFEQQLLSFARTNPELQARLARFLVSTGAGGSNVNPPKVGR